MIPATWDVLLTIACIMAGGIGLCSWWAYDLGYAEGKLDGFDAGRVAERTKREAFDVVRAGLENWTVPHA